MKQRPDCTSPMLWTRRVAARGDADEGVLEHPQGAAAGEREGTLVVGAHDRPDARREPRVQAGGPVPEAQALALARKRTWALAAVVGRGHGRADGDGGDDADVAAAPAGHGDLLSSWDEGDRAKARLSWGRRESVGVSPGCNRPCCPVLSAVGLFGPIATDRTGDSSQVEQM